MRTAIATCALLLSATFSPAASAEPVCVIVGIGADPPTSVCVPFAGDVICVVGDWTHLTPPVGYVEVCVPKLGVG